MDAHRAPVLSRCASMDAHPLQTAAICASMDVHLLKRQGQMRTHGRASGSRFEQMHVHGCLLNVIKAFSGVLAPIRKCLFSVMFAAPAYIML